MPVREAAHMTCRRKNDKRITQSVSGFTLVELLAVIAIIGLLASLALPAISRIRERARIGAAKAQLAHIETALSQYYTEWDTFPPMGNDKVGGGYFPSEDVGRDGDGLVAWDADNGRWSINTAYTGPDRDGTEGNYRLDPGEDTGIMPWLANDPTKGNGRLDGTYYDRLGMFADADKSNLFDEFAKDTCYHYYATFVPGSTGVLNMPDYQSYNGPSGYNTNAPDYYNRWVIYSVGIDGKDHGLHNYLITMQDGEDVGVDGYAGDPMDDGTGTPNSVSDNDGILFEPSIGENDYDPTDSSTDDTRVSGVIRETRWQTPTNTTSAKESSAPGGDVGKLEGPTGNPVFSYDVRQERRRKGQVYAMPDGDAAAYGVIMRYGP
jgi:prepilin-type N-terminal cleavage/methylation domain-containing protein